MREIKFRVWCENKKEMLELQKMSFKTGKCMPYRWNIGYKFNNLMQYTELKDKNGKEIYEGDIVKVTIRYYTDCSREELEREETTIELVVFEHCTFGFKKDGAMSPLLWVLSFDCDIEVIGDIYRNPQLLQEALNG